MANTETLHCKNGNHDWTRPRTRGRKPVNCPSHPVDESGPKEAAPPRKKKSTNDMSAARAAKVQRAIEREQAERKAEAERLREMQKSLPVLLRDYDKALTNALSLNDISKAKHAFDRADNLQRAIINTTQRLKGAGLYV